MKKKISYLVLLLMILVLPLFITYFNREVYSMVPSINKKSGLKLISGEINNDLELTIYYIRLSTLTLYPLKEEDVKDKYYDYKIEIKNNILNKYVKDLEKIDNLKLQKVNKTEENIRILCEFTSNKGKIYSIGLNGYKGDILINGEFYNYNRFFYDFVSNFVPYCEVEYFEKRTEDM